MIATRNDYHASRNKIASYRIRAERAASQFRAFHRLRALGCRLENPAHLGGRHVKVLMRYLTADQTLAEELRVRSGKPVEVPMLASPHSSAYIYQQLSSLRVFSELIGKPGLVLADKRYVSNPAPVRRISNVLVDRSWDGNAVDPAPVLARLAQRNRRTALLLEVILAFGLRRKEALMLVSAHAEGPAHAPPAGFHPGSYAAFVRVKRGTKGGRLRYTAVRTQAQAEALAKARECADGGYLG